MRWTTLHDNHLETVAIVLFTAFILCCVWSGV